MGMQVVTEHRGSNKVMMFVLATALLASSGSWSVTLPADQEEAKLAPVLLQRKYQDGESATYSLKVVLKIEAAGDQELTVESVFKRRVIKLLSAGKASVETSYDRFKMLFGGEETPGLEMPKATTDEVDAEGMNVEVDVNDDSPLGYVLPVFYVPGKAVEIGAAFPVKWSSSGGTLKMSGEGKLIATGRLYEQAVAMVKYDMEVEVKEGPSAKFVYTAYFNRENGRLVKAEGEVTAESEDFGGKFKMDFVVGDKRG